MFSSPNDVAVLQILELEEGGGYKKK